MRIIRTRVLTLLLSIIALILCASAGFATVYVRASSPGPQFDGKSWTTAYHKIQDAINATSCTGGDIWIAASTYNEDIAPGPGTKLYGGFPSYGGTWSSRNPSAFASIIQGSGRRSVVAFARNKGATSLIDGFTITGGGASYGGGIDCGYGSVTVANNKIYGNSAAASGSAIYSVGGSQVIINNEIYSNTTIGRDKRAVCCILGNPTISGNTIHHNDGIGIYCENSQPTITDNIVRENLGEGIRCYNSTATIINNTIADNHDVGMDFSGQPQGQSTVSNNIVAFNVGGISISVPTTLRSNGVYANNVAGRLDYEGVNPGEGDIQVDPLFVDRSNADYHLSAKSPCIDKGANDAPGIPTTDIDGDSRIIDGDGVGGAVVDIGADEYVKPPETRIVYVCLSSPEDGPGNDFAHAFHTVTGALAVAQPGDEVWVSGGAYVESITLKPGVRLCGGFPTYATDWSKQRNPSLYVTYLQAASQTSVITCLPGDTGNAVIDGFTIQGGSGVLMGSDRYGGAIFCGSASPTISNNKITGNDASKAGSAIYSTGSSPSIINNQITSNTSGTVDTGAIHCKGGSPIISGNTVSQNAAAAIYCDSTDSTVVGNTISGGGISCLSGSAVIAGNTIQQVTGPGISCDFWAFAEVTDNTIQAASGPGVYCGYYSLVTVSGNSISNCAGSGILFEYADGDIVLNKLVSNANSQGGGGIRCIWSSPTIISNEIIGSPAGGGIYCDSSSPTITNNTIADTRSHAGILFNGPSDSAVSNNIVAFNTGAIVQQPTNQTHRPVLRNNDVYSNGTSSYQLNPGAGDIAGDPQFANRTQGDYHLSSASACIDAGWNDAQGIPSTDIDGDPRIIDGDAYQGPTVDIGMDEYVRMKTAAIIHVSSDSPIDGPGTNWQNAYHSIGQALAAANMGDETWVARGTYDGGITTKPGVRMYGGFTGSEDSLNQRLAFPRPVTDAYATTILGTSAASVVTVPTWCRENTVIDGFTIRGGGGTLYQNYKYGGGIYCALSAPLITNNIIRENTADLGSAVAGGGMMISNVMEANTANRGGGTIYGGMTTSGSPSPITAIRGTIQGNTIRGNKIAPGVYNPTLGGGISGGYFNCINNLIANNDGCGLLFLERPDGSKVVNNTIVGNSGPGILDQVWISGPTVVLPAVANNISAFNAQGMMHVRGLSHNCVFGNTYGGKQSDYVSCSPTSDINLDPLLANLSAGDCHIIPGSPCIDAADPASAPADDMDHITRPRDGNGDGTAVADIGCYECPNNYMSVAGAKALPDGTAVGIAYCTSTAVFDGRFYIERPDRVCGIGVLGNVSSVGRLVMVEGTMTTIDGERLINASQVTEGARMYTLAPFYMNFNALGGGPCGLQSGVRDWRLVKKEDESGNAYYERDIYSCGGANNIGLLVKTTGRVTNSGDGFFYLDGTCAFDEGDEAIHGIRVVWPSIMPQPPVNSFVVVTGISSCRVVHDAMYGDVVVRQLRPAWPEAVRLLE